MKKKKTNRIQKSERSKQIQPIIIYTDGSGSRPDGSGSAIAWIRDDTGEKHVEMVEGLTNNVAEYRAILSALQVLHMGTVVEVRSDSQLAIYQIRREYSMLDPELAKLREMIDAVILKRKLFVKFTWIPRAQNRADKLLQQQRTKVFKSMDRPAESA